MLRDVSGVVLVDGHAADRVHQDDVVGNGRDRPSGATRLPRRPWPDRVTRRSRPSPPDLDQLGKDREGDLFGRFGADVHAGRRSQRREPFLGETGLLPRPGPNGGGPGRRRDKAHVAGVAPQGPGQGLLIPLPLRRDHDIRARLAVNGDEVHVGPKACGNAAASAIGSKSVTTKPAAVPSSTSAPAIGVVPATQSCGLGRFGST